MASEPQTELKAGGFGPLFHWRPGIGLSLVIWGGERDDMA